LITEREQPGGRELFAVEAASALLDLARIRKVRNTMLASTDLSKASAEQLQQLVALDRYEARAQTRRRRAAARLGKTDA